MLCYPNYDRCPVNVMSSIKKYYGVSHVYQTLPGLDRFLSAGPYKDVFLIVISGMGSDMLSHNLGADEFLRENARENLTAAFPSGMASMMSYFTGVSPNEHARLGKNLFFKEFGRYVNISSNLDAFMKIPVTKANISDFIMPYSTVFEDVFYSHIEKPQSFAILPSNEDISEKACLKKTADSFTRVCELIKMINASSQNTFTIARWDAVRETAEETGCYSDDTLEELKNVSAALSKTCGALKDALVIITADHGMTDLEKEIDISLIPSIRDCLIAPPFIENRAMSFFVKSERKADFERSFHAEAGRSFMLIHKKDVFSKGLLGFGKQNPKISDFVGDFLACAISDDQLKYPTMNTKPKPMKKAASGGLTEQEMIIPLIVAETERTEKYKTEKLI